MAEDEKVDALYGLSITYPRFETWWKERLGIDYPDIPVLPEVRLKII